MIVLTKPMTAWKKVVLNGPALADYRNDADPRYAIVELRIPKGARVVHIPSDGTEDLNGEQNNFDKQRCDKARVVAIYSAKTGRKLSDKTIGYSGSNDYSFEYRIGKTVTPANGFDETERTCESGIHFFDSREKAEAYSL